MRSFSSAIPNPIHIPLVCLILAACGCADSSGVGKTIPVAGKVTVDGQPLTKGTLSYKPDTAKGNTSKFEPASEIDSSGAYSLMTKGAKGAPPGWYKVTIVAEEEVDSTKPTPKSLINPKYKDIEKTPFSIEVKEGAPADAYDLKLTK